MRLKPPSKFRTGNFNGYFMFENKLVLDITTGYILYFTYVLKIFYTQFRPDDAEFGWLNIFRLFHKDIDPKQIQLSEKMAGKLWRSTLGLNNLTKVLIQIEVLSCVAVYVFVYMNTPDYFKYSYTGMAVLAIEFLLIFNIFKTFESFYFMFGIVCKYLAIRTERVLTKMNKYVNHFERKLNDKFLSDETSRSTHPTPSFASELSREQFEPYEIFELLKEHDSICSQVRKYNFFWRFYLFSVFFTMPMIIGYFVFLLTFDPMYYIHRISLACIIILFMSYFYLVTFPAVYLSVKVSLFLCNLLLYETSFKPLVFNFPHSKNQIQKTIYPLKLLNKYRLPIKIKYKLETYLQRFESKVSFNCYEMFDVISETYLDVSYCFHFITLIS